MTTKNASSTGRFVWHELVTSDVRRAVDFYGELFAWKARELEMGPMGSYTMLSIGERDVGGIAPPAPGAAAPRPHWLGYCTVPDVDATARRARDLGATVAVPPTDIPNVGRFTLLLDPQGAPLAPLRMLEESPEVEGKPAPGTFCWDELLSSDVEASLRFHTALLGWADKPMEMGPAGTYHLLSEGEKQRAGLMKAPRAGMPTHWLAYVVVDDVERSAERAAKLGGAVMAPPADIPGIGRFAVVTDPSGAAIALFKGAA